MIEEFENLHQAFQGAPQAIRILLEGCSDETSPLFTLFQIALAATFAMHRFLAFGQPLTPGAAGPQRSIELARRLGESPGEVTDAQFAGWRTGFYFYNAILRIDAASERALRILNDIPDPHQYARWKTLCKGVSLHTKIPQTMPNWESIEAVHAEVNRLKHQQGDTRRLIDEGQAVAALEGMLELCRLAATHARSTPQPGSESV